MQNESAVSKAVLVDSTKDSIVEQKLLLIGAADKLNGISSAYRKELQKYNKRLELLESPIFICPTHKSGGKQYHSRYIKERYWDPEEGRIKHRHIGKEIPSDHVPPGGFPPVPINPLEGLECQIIEDDVIVDSMMYEKFFEIFVGFIVVPIKNWR